MKPAAIAAQKPLTYKSPDNPLDDEFAKLVNETLNYWKVPGLAIAVVDDEEIFAKGYGFATLPNTKATPETLWYGASTTKAFTAATLAHLIDTKKHPSLAAGWNTPISSIIRDDFILQDEWATDHLTLEDAVSHRTGMPRHDMSSIHDIGGRPAVPRDIVRSFRHLPMTAEARVKFQYCNLMFVTLSHVIESLTGKWLGDAIREAIWDPLGMNGTRFDLEDALHAPYHLARGYSWDNEQKTYHAVDHMPVTEVSGAGAIFCNVLDYARWVKSLIHETGPLSEAVHKDIRTPRMISAMPAFGLDVQAYALAWQRFVYRGHVVYTHGGGMHAFGSGVYWLPDVKFGVVAFGNTALTSNAAEEALIFKLIDDKLGVPDEDRIDQKKKWDDVLEDKNKNITEVLDEVFPDRPKEPLPSTVDIDALEGTYHNAGYGNITLRVKTTSNGAEKQKVLRASRLEYTFPMKLDLEHVSGDWWLMVLDMANNPVAYFRSYAETAFQFGVDGKPSAMEVQFTPGGLNEAQQDTRLGDGRHGAHGLDVLRTRSPDAQPAKVRHHGVDISVSAIVSRGQELEYLGALFRDAALQDVRRAPQTHDESLHEAPVFGEGLKRLTRGAVPLKRAHHECEAGAEALEVHEVADDELGAGVRADDLSRRLHGPDAALFVPLVRRRLEHVRRVRDLEEREEEQLRNLLLVDLAELCALRVLPPPALGEQGPGFLELPVDLQGGLVRGAVAVLVAPDDCANHVDHAVEQRLGEDAERPEGLSNWQACDQIIFFIAMPGEPSFGRSKPRMLAALMARRAHDHARRGRPMLMSSLNWSSRQWTPSRVSSPCIDNTACVYLTYESMSGWRLADGMCRRSHSQMVHMDQYVDVSLIMSRTMVERVLYVIHGRLVLVVVIGHRSFGFANEQRIAEELHQRRGLQGELRVLADLVEEAADDALQLGDPLAQRGGLVRVRPFARPRLLGLAGDVMERA
ncbi:penicillin-binding protein [Purpureocillium lavendulum]|uniref:Penicillin-binding protein n=1 Tax=Purpureocillium lavendulum TaxID=1247861 RepID=A0AB34FQZ3_9HYPO|nr:penicillin-binding protein [Purpureocillium lavendulum]